jgi:hypothetical protein
VSGFQSAAAGTGYEVSTKDFKMHLKITDREDPPSPNHAQVIIGIKAMADKQ